MNFICNQSVDRMYRSALVCAVRWTIEWVFCVHFDCNFTSNCPSAWWWISISLLHSSVQSSCLPLSFSLSAFPFPMPQHSVGGMKEKERKMLFDFKVSNVCGRWMALYNRGVADVASVVKGHCACVALQPVFSAKADGFADAKSSNFCNGRRHTISQLDFSIY